MTHTTYDEQKFIDAYTDAELALSERHLYTNSEVESFEFLATAFEFFLRFKFKLSQPCDSDILDQAIQYCEIVQLSSRYEILRILNKNVIARYGELQSHTDLVRQITKVNFRKMTDNQLAIFSQICKESANAQNDSLATFVTIYTADQINEFTNEAQEIINLIDIHQYEIYGAISSDNKEYHSKKIGDNYTFTEIVTIVLSLVVTALFWIF